MGDKNKRRAKTENEYERERQKEVDQLHNSETAKRLNREAEAMEHGHRFGSGKDRS